MSLPVTNLDDRSFQQLVDEAKRKIPELCPSWTNHNVSDPGVALIELFAWMTEMTLFRLNQVPDNFYTRMLNLLGFEQFPATAATTDVTFWLTMPLPRSVPIPSGTEVTSKGDLGEPRVFTTVQPLVVNPPEWVAAKTADSKSADATFDDVFETLRTGNQKVACFPRIDELARDNTEPNQPTSAVGDCFYIGFAAPLSNHLLQLAIKAETESYGSKPDEPPLQWEMSVDGGWHPVSIPDLARKSLTGDATGGLNKDGDITLSLGGGHASVEVNETSAYWLRAVLLPAMPQQPSYRASPQISRLIPSSLGGTVRAEHSESIVGENLGRSTGQPNQRFTCEHTPVLRRRSADGNDGEAECVEVVIDGEAVEWEEVDSFVASSPTDRHYTWDSSTGEIRFGPRIRNPRAEHAPASTWEAPSTNGDGPAASPATGTSVELAAVDGSRSLAVAANDRSLMRQYGAVPPMGATIRIRRYRTGGGAVGNGPSGMLTGLRSAIADVASVDNFVPATGGDDAERVDEAKLRGPMSVRSGDRAVTKSDFVRLTLDAHPGVARVHCVEPAEPGGPVRVLLVPTTDKPPADRTLNDFAISPEMFDSVRAHLDARRVIGTRIEVSTPRYLGVSVAASIRPTRQDVRNDDGSKSAATRDRVAAALYEYISPLPARPVTAKEADELDARSIGLARADPLRRGVDSQLTHRGWSFDKSLHAVDVEQLIESIPGVDSVDELFLFTYDLVTGKRIGSGKKVLPIVSGALFLSARHQVVVL